MFSRTFSGWIITVVLLTGWLATRAAAQSVMLKPKFEPGRTTYLEIQQEIQQNMSGGMAGEAGMKTKIRQVFGMLQKVESAGSKGTRIVLTFDRVANLIEAPMMPSEPFDSDIDEGKAGTNPMADMFGAMLGMSLTMEIDADGKITSFSGMDQIAAKMEEAAGGNPMLAQMRGSFTDEKSKVQWEAHFALYPYKQVSVGDTWSKTLKFSLPPLGDLICEYRCKLDRVGPEAGREAAIVSYTGTIRAAPETQPGAQLAGAQLELESGEFRGTATFDVQRGEFAKQTEDRNMKMRMTLPSPGGEEPAKMRLEQESKHTTTVMTEAERKMQKTENRKRSEKKDE